MSTQTKPGSISQVAVDAEFQLYVARGYSEWIEALAMSIEASITSQCEIKPDILTLANLIRHLSNESAGHADDARLRFKSLAEQPILKRG
ncbi:hypothetical protein GH769_26560 [Pseudomonas sp. CFSAN084952]|uniref:hypothetical protein n=1 Tax=Pseudomonas TaxID=286 RepID=UPI001299D00B|nr:hypothetical protein [Pseudomonas sp. CFSAN084952]QGF96675.1 hypothetical protein GH769_26560 [Pseudomonas sp. CFSAN084952]